MEKLFYNTSVEALAIISAPAMVQNEWYSQYRRFVDDSLISVI
jgi:hypothetical protein